MGQQVQNIFPDNNPVAPANGDFITIVIKYGNFYALIMFGLFLWRFYYLGMRLFGAGTFSRPIPFCAEGAKRHY